MLLNRLEEVREIAKLKRRVDVVEAENAEGKSERGKVREDNTLRLCDATVSQVGSMGGSRRKTAKSVFKAVGLTERYGSGIKRIEDACRRHGGVRVEFENHETWFKVVLSKADDEKRMGESSQKKLGGKLGERRRRIIRMMMQNPSVTTFDLVSEIGISQTAIENNITWLRSHGYVRRVGPDNVGYWEVVEKIEN